jgi:HAE1 family hydrophobic/amphiphilic exporter-1
MSIARGSIRNAVTVWVGVILTVLAGTIALQRVPVQLTPDVEDTVIAVQTRWEGASPFEIEQEIVDKQEERLQGLANLKAITSKCQQGLGTVKLEFAVGTPKEVALREVSDKLREVPDYPVNADEPVVEASDPDNQDFIAWFIIESEDPDVEVRTLADFAEDRVKPHFERVPGVSESNVLGGREREVQVRFDAVRLAQRGVSPSDLVAALRSTNRNVSAGAVEEAKSDVRLRLVSQYESVKAVEDTVVRTSAEGPVFVRDVAEVVEDFKEPVTIVRSRGRGVLALNAQKEVGSNLMEVMAGLRAAAVKLNEPGGPLDAEARRLGMKGRLTITQVYDQTVYIDDALALVEDNIWAGGALALLVLLVFLGSLRGALIIGLAIPISIVGAVVAMLVLGRTVNVVSLAGMAFATGMVVDNAIVVIENIFRHRAMGKTAMRATIDATDEVADALVASTLTTVAVFVPILLVQEEAGQLFRDIALAICAAVLLSLVVAVTIVPTVAARVLPAPPVAGAGRRTLAERLTAPISWLADVLGRVVHRLSGSVLARVGIVALFTAASILGTVFLMPPSDYLPLGNRNLVFGLLIPPPGYSLKQQQELMTRVEGSIRPYWEAGREVAKGTSVEEASRGLPAVPTFDFAKMAPGPEVTPPPLENYFLVSIEGVMFHGGIASDPTKVVDMIPLFQNATRAEQAPGVFAFAFQVPLFRLGGTTGSAVKVNLAGDDLDEVTSSALGVFMDLMGMYGPFSVQPDPSNFNVPGPEMQVVPDLVRLGEAGLTPEDLGLAVQALGDGAVVGEYRIGGDTVDLKVVSREHGGEGVLARLPDAPIATPYGGTVPLSSLGELRRVNAASQINRIGRRRAVTLQVTPPGGIPLEKALDDIRAMLDARRAAGTLPPGIETTTTGSASKLEAVRHALLGDGTPGGTFASAMFLALFVTYLLMCVLFQSWLDPLIIMFSVPLATVGGFAALRFVHEWSVTDRYMPVQNLDVLTMLGFVILIGTVVNNAILLVHQTRNFLRGTAEEGGGKRGPREAVAEAVRTRVRPIFMTTLTTVLGMLPLVVMPGSGSELYRGLGAVVLGGLLVSTMFTLIVVPLLLSLVLSLQQRFGFLDTGEDATAAPPPDAGTTDPTEPSGSAARFAVLLVAAGLLSGCAAGGGPDDGLDRTLASIAARQAAASGRAGEARTLGSPDARLPAELLARRAELESLSGPGLGAPAAAGAAESRRDVTLGEAVATALDRHLGVRALRVVASAEGRSVESAEAAFDAVFFSEVAFDRLDEPRQAPRVGGVVLGADEDARDRFTAEAGLRRTAESGLSMEAALRLERQRDRTPGLDLDPDPSWWTGLTLEARQPLLRGAGPSATRAEIELRRNRRFRTDEELREEMLRVAEGAERAYWDLAEAWRRVATHEDLVRLAGETERVLRERRAFDVASAELGEAVASLELRRADALRARRAVAAASDRLKSWMGRDDLGPLSGATLVPTDGFDETPFAVDPVAAVRAALRERPAVRRAALEIEDAGVREAAVANAGLARLDAYAGVALRGLEDDVAESAGDPFDRDFYGWSVGVAYEIPVGNRAAKAALHEARLRRDASFLRYEETARAVVEQVRDALRDMESAREVAAAARTHRLTQAESLRRLREEEERRASLTPEFLNLRLAREDRLAQSVLQEVAALADFQRARAAWRRATGALPATAVPR